MTCTETLLACLNAEIDEMSVFINLLEQEAELLTNSVSLDTLPAVSQAKQASADKLVELARTRAEYLQASNLADSRTRTHALAADDDALWQAWHILQDLTEQAHSQNLRNGTLIKLHLHHTGQSLHALRAATDAGELYAANGKACPITRRMMIGAG